MKIFTLIQNNIPEPVKVLFAAGTYFGVSQADVEFAIRSAVGLATVIYIVSKTAKIWLKKKGKQQ